MNTFNVKQLQGVITKVTGGMEQLIQAFESSNDKVATQIKCIIKQPLKSLECF